MKPGLFCLANPSIASTLRCYGLILLSSVVVLSHALAQSSAWTRKTDVPIPRMGASASVVKGKIYVFGFGGCYASCHTGLAVNEVYVPLTDTWETEAPLPTPRGLLSTAAANDTLYAIGGAYPTLYDPLGVVEAYDPSTNAWTTRKDMLSPRFAAQAAVVDGILYNIGGNYNERNCEAYDPPTNTWTRKQDRPESGGGLSVTACNGLIYTFGGSTSSLQPLSTVYAYDPQTDTWTEKADMPTARFGLQTYLVDGKIYAIGGTQSANGALATVEVYDPVNNTWESKANMPQRLAWFGGAVVDNKIYVIGGSSDGITAVSTLWEYDPAFHTDIAAGTVSGTWTLAQSPYQINGEITVPNDSTLTVEPGVEVVFMGHYKFNVQGRLTAFGTEQDTIRFRAGDTQAGWHGIRFEDTRSSNDTSKVVYCSFRFGNANTGSGLDRCGGAMLISGFDKVLVSNCLFDSNKQSGDGWDPVPEAGPAIYVNRASPLVTNSTFTNNSGSKNSAIGCTATPNAVITNCRFSNNRGRYGAIAYAFDSRGMISGNIISHNIATEAAGGLLIDNRSTPMIINNVITHNQGFCGGVLCYKSGKPVLIANTIAYNTASYGGGGIGCREDGDPVLINNIIYGNAAPMGKEVALDDNSCDPTILYCDIEGGKAGIGGAGAGANYAGLYEHNIDADPLFVSAALDDYRLSNHSPCIGAGTDSVEVAAGVWYSVPACCVDGNPRPSPAGSKPDIGAYESLLGSPLVGICLAQTHPSKAVLHQNYPNPFNPSTTITYELPKTSHVSLMVYDMLGRMVSVLVNDKRDAGVHEVKFDGTRLASGVYFYRLEAGSYTETRKLVLMD